MRHLPFPSAILISFAALLVAVGFQASSPAEALDVDPVIWHLSVDYPATLPGDVELPIRTVYIKTHDGSDWMSTYDDHPKAVSGPAAIQELIDIYGAQGIQVAAWFVPIGTDYAAQLEVAKQVIDSGVTALYADLEPFPGFCYLQCHELAENLWKPLRQARPNAHLGVIYDPRPWWWQQSATSNWFSVADSALPMCYWESYAGQHPWDDPAGCVVQAHADLAVLAPGRDLDYIPMLQGNTTAARFEQALDAAAGVGSERVSVWRRGVVNTEVWELIADYAEPVFTNCRNTLADGCLFRAVGDAEVFVTAGGAKFTMVDDATFQAMGKNFEDVQVVEAGFIQAIPDVPRDSTLLQEFGGAGAHVIYGGARFPLADGDYALLGLNPGAAVPVPPGAVTTLPAVPADFSRLREVSSADEYVVLAGMRILIDDVVRRALETLGGGGPPYVIPDGTAAAIPLAEISRGDADCSGNIETFDVLQVLQLSSGLPNGAVCYQSADVNCDGQRATLDALLILVFLAAGESPLLPEGCEPIGTLGALQ